MTVIMLKIMIGLILCFIAGGALALAEGLENQ